MQRRRLYFTTITIYLLIGVLLSFLVTVSDVVKLNVVGRIWQTSRSTLVSEPDSFLGQLKQGQIFLSPGGNAMYVVDQR
jgi:hypothetical protein